MALVVEVKEGGVRGAAVKVVWLHDPPYGKGCHSPMYVSIVAEQIKSRCSLGLVSQ